MIGEELIQALAIATVIALFWIAIYWRP